MAGPTIANAEVDVTLDGDGLSAQARRIANRAGGAFTDGFARRLSRAGLPALIGRLIGRGGNGSEAGQRLAESFSEGFRFNLTKNLDNDVALVLRLLGALAPQIAALGSGLSAALVGVLSSALVGLGGALLTVGGPMTAAVLATTMLATQWKDLVKRSDSLRSSVTALSGAWEEQSRAMADLAATGIAPLFNALARAVGQSNIGEALGASIASIAGAFTAVVGSPAFRAFLTALETTFPAALALFGAAIAQISQGLLRLFASAGPAAVQLGESFRAWGAAFAAAIESMAASGQLTAFFDTAVVSVQALMGFINPLAQALGNVFLIGTESGNRMLTTLGELATQFLTFTQSIAGQQALTEWFANGEQIFNALIPLVGALGTMLATLVTPATIAQVVAFLGTFSELLPVLGQVLGVIGELNLLNLVADAMLAIGQAIQPLLPMLSSLASAIGGIDPTVISTLAIAFASLVAAARVVGALLGLNRIILLLTGGSAGLGAALSAVGVALRGLFAAMLANPIGLVIAAVAALVAGLIYFFTQTETGRAAWSSFVSWLQDLWSGLSEWFTGSFLPAMQAVWDGLVAGAQSIGTFFTSAWQGLIDAPQALVDWFTGTLVPFFQALPQLIGLSIRLIGVVFQAAFQMVMDWFTGSFLPFIAGIPGAIASGLGAMVGFFISLPGRIIGGLTTLVSWWLNFWTSLFVVGVQLVTTGITNLVTWFQQLPARIQGIWNAFTAWWTTFWPNLWNSAIAAIQNGVLAAVRWYVQFVGRVQAVVGAVRTLLPQLLQAAWNAAVSAVQRGVSNALTWFSNFVSRAVAFITRLRQQIPDILRGMWASAVSAVQNGISNILRQVSNLASRFVSYIQSLGSRFYSSMLAAMGQGNRAALAGVVNLVSTASAIPGRILGALGNLGSTLYGAGRDLISGLVQGFLSAAGGLYSQAASVAQGVVNAVTGVFDSHSPSRVFRDIGGDVVAGLVQGLDRNARLADNAAAALASGSVGNFNSGISPISNNQIVGDSYRNSSVAAGAIQIYTQTTDPEIAANMVLDRLVTRLA